PRGGGRAGRPDRDGARPTGPGALDGDVPRVWGLAASPPRRGGGAHARLYDPGPRRDPAARGPPRERPHARGGSAHAGRGPRAGEDPWGPWHPRPGDPVAVAARGAPGRLRGPVPRGERVRLPGSAGGAPHAVR